jgi:hypothetical protein
MRTKTILLFIVLTGIIYCGNNYSKYSFSEVAGYVQISKETAQFLMDKMEFPFKAQTMEGYDYIFQKYPLDTLFVHPYIRVQINESGRLLKSELAEFEKDHYNYDPEKKYLWQENESQLNVIIPTNLGSVNIYCYSTSDKFANDKESFKKFVKSISIDPDIKYEPNFIRDSPVLNKILYEGIYKGKYVNFLFYVLIIVIIIYRT